jgi:branched-chain amino acid transport system substrate-binding protein
MSVVGPLTGPDAAEGQAIEEGAKAATLLINNDGGILGRKLQMDIVDDVGDPGDAVPAVNHEIAVDHPIAFVGPITLTIAALQPIFDRNKIVDGFNGGSVQMDTNKDPLLWRCNASDSELGVAMALLGKQQGYHTGVTFFSKSQATDTLVPVVDKAWQTLGGQMLGGVQITPAQTSYRSEVQTVINYHPDVIFMETEPSTGSAAFANFQELNNLAIPFIGDDLTAGSDWIQAIGPKVAQAHVTSVQGSDALTSTGQLFTQAYQQANGHAPLSASQYAYDCTIDFALAITKAKSTDPTVWSKSLIDVSNPPGTPVGDYAQAVKDINAGMKINYEGASGPMDFNKYHNVTGAFDVVKAAGTSDGNVTTLSTITADQIQQVVNQEGGG